MNWLSFVTEQVAKLPLERLFVRPSDNKKGLKDLQEILSESHAEPAETSPEEIPEEAEEQHLEPRQQKVHLASSRGELSTEETAVYQNREIGKLLLRMERHYAQRLRVNGIPCDCGSQKHLLDLESLSEETIPMVDNSDVYYRIIKWTSEVAPKSTDEAAKSGKYDNEYPAFSRQARDFRKEIIGSLEPSALFPQKPGEPEGTSILPVVSEEEKEQIKQKAIQKIEEVLQ
ncbi:hypothetical protein ES705_15625 [subsurface metagenome]